MADFIPLHSGPAYEPLEAELRADITNGRLAPGSKICPETVLAERYSISRGSVRVALENLVRSGLLRKVRGSGTFVTMPEERSESVVSRRQIAFLSFATALSRDAFFNLGNYGPMVNGIMNACNPNGYNLLISHIGPDWMPPPCLSNNDVAGIVFHGPVAPEFYQRWIEPFPNVSIQYRHPDPDGYCVKGDSSSFCYQAVERLKGAGYRRIGFITNEIDTPISLERYYTFRMALKELNLPFERRFCALWQRPSLNGMLEKEDRVADYLPYLEPMFCNGSPESPDAFVCVDDWRAYCTIIALERLGLKVPEDIGITGGNNNGSSSDLAPICISGLNFRLEEVCKRAAYLLFEAIKGRLDGGMTVLIRPHFAEGVTLPVKNCIQK